MWSDKPEFAMMSLDRLCTLGKAGAKTKKDKKKLWPSNDPAFMSDHFFKPDPPPSKKRDFVGEDVASQQAEEEGETDTNKRQQLSFPQGAI